ncbi:5'-nucleotidase C-terminal domain-containing protein [Microbacteriaceae bacterium 4G12]
MVKKKLFTSLFATSLIAVPAFQGHHPVVHAEQNYVGVQILSINDFHGAIDSVSKLDGKEVGGADYLSAHFKQREAEATTKGETTIKVHAGDAVGASPSISSLLQDEPTMKALDTMGFEIGTLGNHEFDEGIPELKRLLKATSIHENVAKYTKDYPNYSYKGIRDEFKYISANVIDKNTGKSVFDPYTIKEVNGIKIGFIGVTTTETPTIVMPAYVKDYEFLDEADTINKYTKELQNQGVHAIVVISHDDVSTAKDGTGATGRLAEIAQKVDNDVDILIGGHSHQYANGVVNGKMIVQAYSSGKAFVDLDAKLDPTTQDFVKGETKAEIVPNTRDITPDAQITSIINEAKQITSAVASKPIGYAPQEIIGKKGDQGETTMGNLVTDGQRIMTGAQLAITNSGGIRDDIKAGEVTWGAAYAVQPFGNQILVKSYTGQQIKDALEQQWSRSDRDVFLQISGFKYTYKKAENPQAGEPRFKVVDMMLADGTPMDMNKTYTVAINEFVAGGGDQFTKFRNGTLVKGDKTDTEIFVSYIEKLTKEGKQVEAAMEGRATLVDGNATNPDTPNNNGNTDNSGNAGNPDNNGNAGNTGSNSQTDTNNTTPPSTNVTDQASKADTSASTNKDKKDKLPVTATSMFTMLAVGLAAIAGAFFLRRKKQNN